MDPLTAVGLASNIVQFVSFVGELLSKGREISRNADGALIENLELEAITNSLMEMSDNLALIKGFAPSASEIELTKLCDGSREVARELLAALQKLKASNSKTQAWKSFRQALNSVCSAEKIRALSQRLERYQKQIHTTLLVSLRENLQEYEYERGISANSLDKQLQDFIESSQKWQLGLIQFLHESNQNSEAEYDMHTLSTMLYDGAEIDRKELHTKRIHNSLLFSEIEERHERIAEAHKNTFEWIFHNTNRSAHPQDPAPESSLPLWDSFIDWIRGDQTTPYWITGKPGSGKSTLMKYLYHDNRTLAHANHWSQNQTLVTAGFFFWNSGTVMQMSFLGLLQSLLYQCVSANLEVIPRIFPTRWQNYLLYGRDLRPWSMLELKNALKTFIGMKEFHFMVFIDGLDEFDKDPSELAAFVSELGKGASQNLKLCLASRPWLIFEETFRQFPRLRVENLTRDDIQRYVEENLKSSPRWEDLVDFQPDAAVGMMTEIVDKASGVFLWVVLVVSSLLEGLREGDTIRDLFDRLHQLPSELEDLFRKILDQLDPKFFAQASELFQLVESAVEPLTLLSLSYAIEGYIESMDAPVAPVKIKERSFRVETMRRRIQSRCKGLLESSPPELHKHKATVQYLHRTVRDFIRNRTIWEYITSGVPDFEPLPSLCGSYLRQVKMTRRYPLDESIVKEFWTSFLLCIRYAKMWESSKNSALTEVYIELELTGNAYWNSLSNGRSHKTLLEDFINDVVPYITERRVWDQVVLTGRASEPVIHWVNTSWLDPPKRLPENVLLYDSFFAFCFINECNSYVMAKVREEGSGYNNQAAVSNLLTAAVRSINMNLAFSLLEYGADPNFISSDYWGSPWEELFAILGKFRVKEDAYNAVDRFLDYGADPTKIPSSQSFDDYLMQKLRGISQRRVYVLIQKAKQKQALLQHNAKKTKPGKGIMGKFKSWQRGDG